MGNFNLYSKTAETEEPVALDQSFSSRVNDIAIHYILKQNVIDLLRLTDKEYSDNLIVLVSSVFEKNLTHEEIGLLNSHIESETIQEAIFDLIPSNETAKKKDAHEYRKVLHQDYDDIQCHCLDLGPTVHV